MHLYDSIFLLLGYSLLSRHDLLVLIRCLAAFFLDVLFSFFSSFFFCSFLSLSHRHYPSTKITHNLDLKRDYIIFPQSLFGVIYFGRRVFCIRYTFVDRVTRVMWTRVLKFGNRWLRLIFVSQAEETEKPVWKEGSYIIAGVSFLAVIIVYLAKKGYKSPDYSGVGFVLDYWVPT